MPATTAIGFFDQLASLLSAAQAQTQPSANESETWFARRYGLVNCWGDLRRTTGRRHGCNSRSFDCQAYKSTACNARSTLLRIGKLFGVRYKADCLLEYHNIWCCSNWNVSYRFKESP